VLSGLGFGGWRAIGIVPRRKADRDTFTLPTQMIVVIFVQVHHFFEIVLATFHAMHELLIDEASVALACFNCILSLSSLTNEIIYFVEQATLLFSHLFT